MKYVSGLENGACKGLRTHICHAPSVAAAANTRNENHRCARISLLLRGTVYLSLSIRMELIGRHDLHARQHLAVSQPAELMAWHQKVAYGLKHRVNLTDIARHDHGVDIGAGDQDAVNHVRTGQPQR